MILRPATEDDAAAIVRVRVPLVRDTLITFTTLEPRPEDVAAEIRQAAREGWAYFVATEGQAVGFASYRPFRTGPGYARTMELSVNLVEEAAGKGTGRALIAQLERHARDAGVHALIAGVSGANQRGLRFFRQVGYEDVGRLPGVGYKFGKFLDLVLLQKTLPPET
ncbi:MAG: N-acetyltransferase family protein [Pseudomonadota bacterium]